MRRIQNQAYDRNKKRQDIQADAWNIVRPWKIVFDGTAAIDADDRPIINLIAAIAAKHLNPLPGFSPLKAIYIPKFSLNIHMI